MPEIRGTTWDDFGAVVELLADTDAGWDADDVERNHVVTDQRYGIWVKRL